MQIVEPEMMSLVAGLSLGLTIAGFVLGLALWLTGWKLHRFWMVLSLTLGAGMLGLSEAPTLRSQPLIAGVLLAIAGGVLALNLVRLIAFLLGGAVCLVLCQLLAPQLDQPLVVFLAGGLLGFSLFRLWWILLTSGVGTLLLLHCGVGLCEPAFQGDAADWAHG